LSRLLAALAPLALATAVPLAAGSVELEAVVRGGEQPPCGCDG
jgi:hypothetical protein